MNIQELNIKQIREQSNLSQAEMAERLGISREMINMMELGKRSISKSTKILLQNFMNEVNSVTNLNNGSQLSYAPAGKFPKKMGLGQQVPVFDVEFTAGFLEQMDANNNIIGYIDFMPEFSGCDAIVRCRNNSMSPIINPNDWVGIRRIYDMQDLEYRAIYGIVTKNFSLFKYIYKSQNEGNIILKSANKDYEEREILLSKIIELWAVQATVPISLIKTYI